MAKASLLEGATEGNLVILDAWPGQMRTVFRDHERFIQTYFSTFPGKYFTGDGARRDADGYYWITGRVDDVLNVSGHRMGTAEIESALVAHPKVAEAAVVGMPHDIKGQGIYAYVTLIAGEEPTDALKQGTGRLGAEGNRPHRLAGRHPMGAGPAQDPIRQDHAPHPAQDRRQRDNALGDTSTLADPTVVTELVENRVALPAAGGAGAERAGALGHHAAAHDRRRLPLLRRGREGLRGLLATRGPRA
jgi:acetyl-CoA synthetase